MTPAMAAGVVSSPMEVSDIVRMIEERAVAEKAEALENSYNPFGDALGGKGLK